MRNSHIVIVVSLFSIGMLYTSCKSLKGNKEHTEVDNVAAEESSRFIVSFYSPGNGIDRNAKNKFDAFLKKFEPTLAYTTTKWGREGEVDYCFDLTELSAEQQEAFIASAKELLSTSKKVRFSENETCRDSR